MPSTPTFIRVARNRSLRANVMWTNPLVKILRPIAGYGSYRNLRGLRFLPMPVIQTRPEPLYVDRPKGTRRTLVLRQMVCAVVDFAAFQVVVEPRAVHHGELP